MTSRTRQAKLAAERKSLGYTRIHVWIRPENYMELRLYMEDTGLNATLAINHLIETYYKGNHDCLIFKA